MRHPRTAVGLTLLLTAMAAGACGDGDVPTGPELQVIEDTEFASSLEIDLSAMTVTESGVYYEDVEDGEGDPVGDGDAVTVGYTGYLSDATVFDDGTFTFTLGASEVIPGFEDGVTGMRPDGVRRMIIPPELAYGTQAVGTIPPGSILIFDVEVVAVQ
jgi:FKBP-type peptidyl-prolyl cis-trans isomerase